MNVFFFVVVPVFVDMVDSKYFFEFIISTFFTLIYKIFVNHFFSYRSIFWLPAIFEILASTSFRAIFSIHAWGIFKNYSTMKASIVLCPFVIFMLSFVITLSRAVFSFHASARLMTEFIATNKAICSHPHAIGFIFTRSTAIFKCFYSVIRNINLFFTKQTCNIRSFHYATR